MNKNKFLLLLALSGFLSLPALATNYTWDESGGGTFGGSGTWNTSSAYWWNGSSDVAFVSSASNNVTFTGTAGSVSFGASTLQDGTTTFSTTGYTLVPNSGNYILKTSGVSLGSGVNLNIGGSSGLIGFEVTSSSGVTGGSGATLTLVGSGETTFEFQKSASATPSTVNVSVPIIVNGSTGGAAIYISSRGYNTSAEALNANITGGISLAGTNTSALGLETYYSWDTVTIGTNGGAGISGTGANASGSSVLFASDGTIVLNAVNTYTGASYVTGPGVVRLGAANVLPDTDLSLGGAPAGNGASTTGALDLNGQSQNVASLDGVSTAAGIYNGTSTLATLTIDGSGNSTYASQIGSTTALVGTTGGNTTLIANPTSKIAVVMSGTGTQTFSGESLYSGGTTVSGGLLAINNASGGSGTGTGAVLVNGTGTLGGTGFIAPTAGTNVTIGSTGTLAPGVSGAGTLTFNLSSGSVLSLNSGAVLALDLGTVSSSVGFGSVGDWLNGSSGNATLSLTEGAGFNYSNSYVVFSNVSTAGFTFASITGYDSTDYTAMLTQSGNNYDLTFQPQTLGVPEPNTSYVLLLGGLGLLIAVRRHYQMRRNLAASSLL